MRASELADALDMEVPHAIRQWQKLTDTGYIMRAPDPADDRARLSI